MISLNSSSANRRLFHSAPLLHCAVEVCLPFSVLQETSMLHRGHRRWGRFPSSKMTTVSRTCRCIKCTHIAFLVAARPGHPSIGQLYGLPWPGSPCGTYADLPLWPRLYRSIFPLPIAHAVSSCAPPIIPPPSSPRTPCTSPVPSAAPGRRVPLLSSVAHTPPPSGSPPPGMGGIPCQLSS